MILERLIELRDRMLDDPESGITPAYHKRQPVKWVLEISSDGTFEGLLQTGKTKKEIKEFETPYAKRTSGVLPLLLADKAEYSLGDSTNDSERHTAFRQLATACAKHYDLAPLRSYITFLESPVELEKARQEAIKREVAPGEIIIPRVDGITLTNLPEVRRYWQDIQDAEAAEQSGLEAECMVCGEPKPIARTHPVELLVGADRVGMVTANSDAFLSYGLRQSEVAPMCQGCARGYGEGLNYLLKNEGHRLRTSSLTWVFWTREETELNFAQMISDPQLSEVKALLQSVQKGRLQQTDTNAFYALALSSNKSRLIVRNWLNVSLVEAKESLSAYFNRQKISGRDGEDHPIKLMGLAGATVRDLKDLPPQTVPALFNNAFCGTPLPIWMLQQALARARAERENVMTRPRAALIKMVLLSNNFFTEEIMPGLNPEHPHPAYHCGRLLALLDDVQQKAIGARATLVDRYYGAASSTPAMVFGGLLRNAQNHLSKLRKTQYGRFHFFDRTITEITAHIPAFPKVLTLEEQGLFALGFYQQRNRPKADNTETEATTEPALQQEVE